jgi:hypothetical protein
MNWKGCGMMWMWSNLLAVSYYLGWAMESHGNPELGHLVFGQRWDLTLTTQPWYSVPECKIHLTFMGNGSAILSNYKLSRCKKTFSVQDKIKMRILKISENQMEKVDFFFVIMVYKRQFHRALKCMSTIWQWCSHQWVWRLSCHLELVHTVFRYMARLTTVSHCFIQAMQYATIWTTLYLLFCWSNNMAQKPIKSRYRAKILQLGKTMWHVNPFE